MAKAKLPIAKASVEPVEVDNAERMRYRAEDALRDIERAEAHRKDKALMKSVKTLAKEKVKCLSKI